MKKFFKFLLLIITYICMLLCACFIILVIANKGNIQGIRISNMFTNVKEKTFDEITNNGLVLNDKSVNSTLNKQDRFYYEQLSDVAKYIYDTLTENRDKLETGTAEIELKNPKIDDMLLEDESMESLRDEYQNAIDSLKYDDVTWYFIDFTKMALKTTTYTRGEFKWFDVSLGVLDGKDTYLQDDLEDKNLNKIFKEIENQKDTILEDVSGSDYEKIKQVHDWLVDNIEYDDTYNLPNNRNIYGGLINNKTVCEGYAKTFKYLLDELDIPCILVAGTAKNSDGKEENHMWNYVELLGTWYSFDVTWDDPILINGAELRNESKYKYFCQGDNINSNHYISYTITDSGQEYDFPKLYHKEIE